MPEASQFLKLLIDGGLFWCVIATISAVSKCYVAHQLCIAKGLSDEKVKWISKMMSKDRISFPNKHIDN